MKHLIAIAIAAALSLNTSMANAQDEGTSLMEQGARLFLEGILREMEPVLEDLEGLADEMGPALRDFSQEMGPALTDLMTKVEDWSAYDAPEILPNGDIIMRKKQAEEILENPEPPVDL